MTSASPAPTFEVRHLQIARAALAAIAAIMVTFSPDHSAAVGMSVFSGFAIATGLVFLLSVWLVYPAGRRWPAATLGSLTLLAGMVAGVAPMRSVTGYFTIVIAWALLTGAFELVSGWRGMRAPKPRREIAPGVADARPVAPRGTRSESRDAVVVGAITLVLGLALLVVPTQFALDYTIEEANRTFTLTGITIGVGILGGYAAIVAVYLAIAGFSPRESLPAATDASASATADQKDPA